ncbi:MAG: hypothetical protein KatS3mg110_0702 [Pirellulaceae bacterium]|nr:MAG: hypothetical protein KatS3mg110_0702 [Pirellulaceae bacterium]
MGAAFLRGQLARAIVGRQGVFFFLWILPPASLLAVAGLGKSLAVMYGVPVGMSKPLAAALSAMELGLAWWLLSGMAVRVALVCAVGTFSLFLATSVWRAITGDAHCGCLGIVATSPALMAVLDAAVLGWLLVPLVCRFAFDEESPDNTDPVGSRLARHFLLGGRGLAFLSTISAVALLVLRMAGVVHPRDSLVILHPREWLGKSVAEIHQIPELQALKDGKWHVLLYRENCPRCQEARAELLADKKRLQAAGYQIAWISVPDGSSEVSTGHDFAHQPASIRLIQLSRSRTWIVSTPVHLVIDNGVVMNVSDGWERRYYEMP